MIKFKNIKTNIGLINNEVKMKKLEKMKADNSQKENENYMQSLKSNESLKKVLFKAKNISTTLMTNIVPQLATSIKSVVAEMLNNKNITKLKDWNTIKFLRIKTMAGLFLVMELVLSSIKIIKIMVLKNHYIISHHQLALLR